MSYAEYSPTPERHAHRASNHEAIGHVGRRWVPRRCGGDYRRRMGIAIEHTASDDRGGQTRALLDTLEAPGDERLARSKRRTLGLLERAEDPFDRGSYDPGHITASAVVLSADKNKVLLVFHERLQVWLQPGGHVEPSDPSSFAAAQREVIEETGVLLSPEPTARLYGVDVHEIPAARGEPPHLHHDLVFRLFAETDEVAASPEVRSVVWCPVTDLAQYDVDQSLRRAVERAVGITPTIDANRGDS